MLTSKTLRTAHNQLISLKAFQPRLHPGTERGLAAQFSCGATPKEKELLRQQVESLQEAWKPEARKNRKGGKETDSSDRLPQQTDEKADSEDGEGWDVDAEEDIFNLDAQGGNSGEIIADFGWGVEDLDDDEDEDSEWQVTAAPPSDAQAGAAQKAPAKLHQERNERWQESAAMRSLPRHVLQTLHKYQDEVDAANKELTREKQRRNAAEGKVHRRLRVINGSFAGRRLLSGRGETTRPMMEKVRAAAFDMLQARCGVLQLPEETKWLDLFAGTGSVGLEALSRGAGHCSFIELDRWVVDTVLMPNLTACRMVGQSAVHTMRAEDFLQRAKSSPEYYSAFDFISVCPPYLKVSYEELFQLLEDSPLVHAETHILVEYPRKSKNAIPPALGPLTLVKDRKFGRTNLAVYGPE